jgi:glycosyltransferase involved in cell wall biosynthesis
MKIALSMLTLVPGGMGGSETYARELTAQLAHMADVEATAVLPATAAGFSRGIPETVIASIRVSPSNAGRLKAIASIVARSLSIRRVIAGVDVVHFPFTVPVPRPARNQAMVQTLLDVQHLDLPHLFSRAELLYRRVFYEGAARKADLVITISEFARQRMIELLGLPADRVVVAHLGVDTTQFVANHGARENFVLYPARGWAHKNHPRLIAAMEILRSKSPDLRLVLTGGGLESLGELPDWVDRKGMVSAEELRALYRSAAVLAFPSLYEGFGLPPLEAMASGCPVAASNAGSIPEVCGDAAVLFDATNPDDIARGIGEAIARSTELSAAGPLHAQSFSWEACARVHVEAYRRALAVRRGIRP